MGLPWAWRPRVVNQSSRPPPRRAASTKQAVVTKTDHPPPRRMFQNGTTPGGPRSSTNLAAHPPGGLSTHPAWYGSMPKSVNVCTTRRTAVHTCTGTNTALVHVTHRPERSTLLNTHTCCPPGVMSRDEPFRTAYKNRLMTSCHFLFFFLLTLGCRKQFCLLWLPRAVDLRYPAHRYHAGIRTHDPLVESPTS
jgi:hypothetical protein